MTSVRTRRIPGCSLSFRCSDDTLQRWNASSLSRECLVEVAPLVTGVEEVIDVSFRSRIARARLHIRRPFLKSHRLACRACRLNRSERRRAVGSVASSASKSAATVTEEVCRECDECPICFEEIAQAAGRAKEAMSTCTSCRNSLHKDCLDRWLKKANSCPFCRANWSPRSAQSSGLSATEESGYLNLYGEQRKRRRV